MKVNINTCRYADLRALPGIGKAISDYIWSYRNETGQMNIETFCIIPHLRITPTLLSLVEFGIPSTGS